jgi:hypothetical protein
MQVYTYKFKWDEASFNFIILSSRVFGRMYGLEGVHIVQQFWGVRSLLFISENRKAYGIKACDIECVSFLSTSFIRNIYTSINVYQVTFERA